LRTAFALFSAYGMHEAAATVGHLRLEGQPDDPVQRYLLDAVGGQTHDRAPAAYVEAHFDEFAAGFDSKLVDILGYKVPQQLADMVASCRPTLATILDLGCGTGLAAEPLGRFGARLTGIDLSEKMLAIATRRNAYHDLIKADVVSYLADSPRSFDLVFAADLLIYLGRLEELIGLIARVLPAGGLFAASIEARVTATSRCSRQAGSPIARHISKPAPRRTSKSHARRIPSCASKQGALPSARFTCCVAVPGRAPRTASSLPQQTTNKLTRSSPARVRLRTCCLHRSGAISNLKRTAQDLIICLGNQ
jgi:predicted TPR repeat methyltransferase